MLTCSCATGVRLVPIRDSLLRRFPLQVVCGLVRGCCSVVLSAYGFEPRGGRCDSGDEEGGGRFQAPSPSVATDGGEAATTVFRLRRASQGGDAEWCSGAAPASTIGAPASAAPAPPGAAAKGFFVEVAGWLAPYPGAAADPAARPSGPALPLLSPPAPPAPPLARFAPFGQAPSGPFGSAVLPGPAARRTCAFLRPSQVVSELSQFTTGTKWDNSGWGLSEVRREPGECWYMNKETALAACERLPGCCGVVRVRASDDPVLDYKARLWQPVGPAPCVIIAPPPLGASAFGGGKLGPTAETPSFVRVPSRGGDGATRQQPDETLTAGVALSLLDAAAAEHDCRGAAAAAAGVGGDPRHHYTEIPGALAEPPPWWQDGFDPVWSMADFEFYLSREATAEQPAASLGFAGAKMACAFLEPWEAFSPAADDPLVRAGRADGAARLRAALPLLSGPGRCLYRTFEAAKARTAPGFPLHNIVSPPRCVCRWSPSTDA